MSRWFFLSYARDNHDEYLQRFYRDLNEKILLWTNPGEGEAGFLDVKDIELGKHWLDTLSAELQNCRTFISLYSPVYFASEQCGKEWQLFSERQAAYSADLAPRAGHPSLIMPVLWVPEKYLPKPLLDAVSAVQYNHRDFGDLYAKEGLQQLMRVNKFKDDYEEFVKHFAKKLIEAARACVLPPLPQTPPFNEIENAFQRREPEVVMYAEEPVNEPVNMGPRFVKFIYVAGRRDELLTVREKVDPYGEIGGCDWIPYLPDVPDEVGITAQRVATNEVLFSEHAKLEGDIITLIKEARKNNNIVAIIVDTWTLLLPQYFNHMNKYDDHNFLNSVVVVAWNNKDEELTVEKRARLEARLRKAFDCNSTKADRNCFLEINSYDELVQELPNLMNHARAWISKSAKVVKRAGYGPPMSKPIINGNGVRGASA